MRGLILTGMVVVLCFVSAALGQLPISISGPGGSVEQNERVGGKWRIKVKAVSSAAPVTFTITGTSSDPIDYVLVEALNSGQQARVVIRGESGGSLFAIPSIDEIAYVASPTGTVVVFEAKTSGDLGSIDAHSIVDLQVQGDITGDITITQSSGGSGGAIQDIDVDGDVLGNIFVATSIVNVLVDGDIGSSTNTVSIDAVTRIDRIRANRIWSDITLDTTSTNGNFGRLETTGGASGHFDGSLTTRLLNPFGTLNFSDMVIDGDLNATLHFTEDARAPITIGGDVASTALIDVDDDIDDNGSSTDGRIVIAGECAGINAGTSVAVRDYGYLIEVDLP